MPYKCPCCDGWGKRSKTNAEGNWKDTVCSSCDGTGLVWDRQSVAHLLYPYYPYPCWGPYTRPVITTPIGSGGTGGVVTNGTVWTTSKT